MRSLRIGRMVVQNLRRNLRHFIVSAFGIVVGIASFVFFLGLSGGVREVVNEIFPITRVEVIAPRTTLTGIQVPLDEDVVRVIAERPEVKAVYPKMKMAFPSKGGAILFKARPQFPLGGFCDGIDPALVKGDSQMADFKDWEAEEAGRPSIACDPGPRPEPEEEWRAQCPASLKEVMLDLNEETDAAERARLEALRTSLEARKDQCPKDHYCGWDRKCHHRVPVIVSRTMLELFNSSFAPAHGIQRIPAVAELFSSRLRDLEGHIELGRAHIEGTRMRLQAPVDCMGAMLLGLNNKAVQIGMTVPIGYVKRWNEKYLGPDAPKSFSSILVDVKQKKDVAAFVSWVNKAGYEQEESYAENFALVITIVTLLFLLISLIIIAISAVNIAHTFFMLISDRKREIGILRAVGAARFHIRGVILGEAALIGILGGVLGVVVGVAFARLVDVLLLAKWIPDFPFKPKTLFAFTPELLLAALGFAVLFCILGAYLPARKAARIQPAQALVG